MAYPSSQHAGIAAESGTGDEPLTVYAVSSPKRIREVWGRGKRYAVRVAGWVGGEFAEETRGAVLRQCERIALLVDRTVRLGLTPCCWQIYPDYRTVVDDDNATVVFTGSCAGFVEYCYEKAGSDLVVDAELPESTFAEGEQPYIQAQYYNSPTRTIRRLYPSYQIRALQVGDTAGYPWIPDLRFRWFPDGFYG